MNAPSLPGNVEVVVVGAGPVGLTAAIALAGRERSVCVVDELPAPRPESRALAIWPRTRDILTDLDVLRPGEPPASLALDAVSYQFGASTAMPLPLQGRSRALIMPQPGLEQALRRCANDLGIPVVRGGRLVSLAQDLKGVTARIVLRGSADVDLRCQYLIGADGAASTVRQLLNIAYEGTTLPTEFYLADCTLAGFPPDGVFHNYVNAQGYAAICPLPDGRHRVFARLEQGSTSGKTEPATILGDVGLSTVRVMQTHWTSTFKIHERLSERFRDRRVFLAGDAAHTHSPAGGQGIQTGIGDAHNLAWKLAAVLQGTATDALLNSYETERVPVARAVIARSSAQSRLWDTSTALKRRRSRMVFTAMNRLGILRTRVLPAMLGYSDAYPAGPGQRSWAKQRLHKTLNEAPAADMTRFASGLRLLLCGDWSLEEETQVDRLRALHPLIDPETGQVPSRATRRRREIVCIRPDGYVLFRARNVNQIFQRLQRISELWEKPKRYEIGDE